MAELVGRFCRHYPDVAVDLSAPEDTSELVDLLRTGQCELGIGEETGLPSDLRVVPVEVQRLLVILPPGSPVKTGPPVEGGPRVKRGPLRLGDLADMRMIATPRGTSSRRLLEEGFAAAGVVPRVSVVTAQREAILPLVLAGAGASLVPEPMADIAAQLGAVVAEPRPAVERRIVVAARQGPLAPAAQGFLSLLDETDDSTR
jgi:DNA-binding transcriptional LysR family regulator